MWTWCAPAAFTERRGVLIADLGALFVTDPSPVSAPLDELPSAKIPHGTLRRR
jgi:hypothetical protein